MPRKRSGQAYCEAEGTPGPSVALNRFASVEIPGLEPVWADSDAPAHQLEGPSDHGSPLSVSTYLHTCQLNVVANGYLQRVAGLDALPGVTLPEPVGPDLF